MNTECPECTTLYAPELKHCPHCGAENPGDDMPKTTLHGGSSHAGVDSPAPGLTAQETSDSDAYEYVKPPETDTDDGELRHGNPDSPASDSDQAIGTGSDVPPADTTSSTDSVVSTQARPEDSAVKTGEPVTLEKTGSETSIKGK